MSTPLLLKQEGLGSIRSSPRVAVEAGSFAYAQKRKAAEGRNMQRRDQETHATHTFCFSLRAISAASWACSVGNGTEGEKGRGGKELSATTRLCKAWGSIVFVVPCAR